MTLLSGLNARGKNSTIIEVKHDSSDKFLKSNALNMFAARASDKTAGFDGFKIMLPTLAREIYTQPQVLDLYNNRDKYDMFIVDEIFNEVSCYVAL